MSVGTHAVKVYPPAQAAWARVPMANDDFAAGMTNWRNPLPANYPAWTVGAGVVSSPLGTPAPAYGAVSIEQSITTPRGTNNQWRVELDVTATSAHVWAYVRLYFSTTAAPTSGRWLEVYIPSGLGGTYTWVATFDSTAIPAANAYVSVNMRAGSSYAPADPGTLTIDAVRLYAPAPAVDISCLVDEVAIQHGRDDTTAQPEASTATLALDLTNDVLPSGVDIGSDVIVTTTVAGQTSTRFHGRVTDVSLGWDEAGENTPSTGQGQLTAAGYLADMGRRVVGDQPFPQELDGTRVQRLLTLAGFHPSPVTSDPGTVQVNARDIDARAALEVAQDTADSASGLVWQTRDSDVRYADASHRRGIPSALTLDACDVLVTPTWSRTLQGLVNKVTVSYGVAPEGGEQPTYAATNPTSVTRYGTYDYSLTSELAALADAQSMAGLLLARNSSPVWVMTALPVDVKNLDDERTVTLLGLDMHALVTLTGLPLITASAPTSAALWVEGWTERIAWGEHEIELHVSGYCRTAPAPRWDDVDTAETWDTANRTWDQAACFGPPVSFDRWTDTPASLRWDTLPAGTTWDNYAPTGGTL